MKCTKFFKSGLLLAAIGAHHLDGQAFGNVKVNTDNTTQIQNEQQIVVNPTDSLNFVCVWRDFRVGFRQVGHAASFDGGETWTAETLFVEPSYIWDSDPGLTVDADGNFFAIILSFFSTSEPNGYFVFESTDKGISWSAPRTVIDQVPNVFEDKEFIACDRTSSPHRGNLYVTWARFVNFYSPAVYFTRSTDRGFNWSAPFEISDVSGNLQFPVPAVGPAGQVYVAWVTANAIKFDRSTNGGVSFGTDVTVKNVASMARYVKNGIIWTFSFPAIDVDITGGPRNGNIYIAYMDTGTDGYPDMFFTRSTDQGATWSGRVRINDDPVGNHIDQFHPWLTVDAGGNISVIFYDSRNDAGNLLCDLYLAQSTDGGLTWLPNTRVSTVSFDLTVSKLPAVTYRPNVPLAGRAGWIGEYNGVAATSLRNVVPVWTDTREGNQNTYVGYPLTAVEETPETRTAGPVNIRPSIVADRMVVECPAASPGQAVSLAVYDAGGRRVIPFAGRATDERGCFILTGLDRLCPGAYFVAVEAGGRIEIAKFLKLGGVR